MSVETIAADALDAESRVSFLHQKSVDETYHLHDHQFCELFLVLRGKAIHFTGEGSYLIRRGSLVFVRPRDAHRYGSYRSSDFEFVNLGFSVETCLETIDYCGLARSMFFDERLSPHRVLDEKRGREAAEIFFGIRDRPAGEERRIFFKCALPSLLYRFVGESADTRLKPLPSWLPRLVELMMKPANLTRGLPRMQELSGFSPEYLARSFKSAFGQTPTDFINEARLKLAARLLREGEESILSVCEACGFTNLSHFYHLFSRQYGYPPGEWRRLGRARALADGGTGSPPP